MFLPDPISVAKLEILNGNLDFIRNIVLEGRNAYKDVCWVDAFFCEKIINPKEKNEKQQISFTYKIYHQLKDDSWMEKSFPFNIYEGVNSEVDALFNKIISLKGEIDITEEMLKILDISEEK
ncbi:MAG: hypothetical protein J6M62_02175 [Selenomonadaceae bacterium]|nr:hypothetical protein [Selenomonadaceae bacterium]